MTHFALKKAAVSLGLTSSWAVAFRLGSKTTANNSATTAALIFANWLNIKFYPPWSSLLLSNRLFGNDYAGRGDAVYLSKSTGKPTSPFGYCELFQRACETSRKQETDQNRQLSPV